jgi:hypothetical protein
LAHDDICLSPHHHLLLLWLLLLLQVGSPKGCLPHAVHRCEAAVGAGQCRCGQMMLLLVRVLLL